VNPQIYPGLIYGDLTGTLTPADQQLIDDRGPGDLVNQITAPTLLIQGTVDTLFTLAEADANAKALIANGVPSKVVWFCGGHGACLSTTNDGVMVKEATMDWLDRYVKGDLTVDTGPQFEWVDQHGQEFSSHTYPVAQGTAIVASSAKGVVLPLLPIIGGSGPEPRILACCSRCRPRIRRRPQSRRRRRAQPRRRDCLSHRPPRSSGTSTACSFSASNGTTSMVRTWVAASTTGAAQPSW
jgi:hypothetical protein